MLSPRVRSNGFTLIELLVVIAIIGILAAIVLASLGVARNKGSDASVKGMLKSVQNAADTYNLSNNSAYGTSSGTAGSCGNGSPNGSAMWADTTSNMAGIITALTAAVGSGNIDCGTSGLAWSVAVKLPSGDIWWCVDSAGKSKGNQGSTATPYAGLNGGATHAKTSAGATVCN